jgi:hypothetical protein
MRRCEMATTTNDFVQVPVVWLLGDREELPAARSDQGYDALLALYPAAIVFRYRDGFEIARVQEGEYMVSYMNGDRSFETLACAEVYLAQSLVRDGQIAGSISL